MMSQKKKQVKYPHSTKLRKALKLVPIPNEFGKTYISLQRRKLPTRVFKTLKTKEKLYGFQLKSLIKKREFFLSRFLLRKALKEEVKSHHFLKDKNTGALLWPKPFRGSISHKENLVAFIYKEESQNFFGVDLETFGVSKKAYERITSPSEKALTPFQNTEAYTLLFSVKESLWKAFSQASTKEEQRFYLKDCLITQLCLKEQAFEGELRLEKKTLVAKGKFHWISYKTKTKKIKKAVLSYCKTTTV